MSTSLEINPQASAEDKISVITTMIAEMTSMLKAQRDLLAQRNLVLPLGPADELLGVNNGLNLIAQQLEKDSVETGQFRELARVTEIINSRLDLNMVLNEVIDTVIQLTKAERGYIVLKNLATGELETSVARNMTQSTLAGNDFIISQTVVTRVAESGVSIVTTNAEQDERFQGSASISNYMLRSILCTPLKHRGHVIGVIYADNRMRPGVFGEREQRLVNAFANQAAIAIENARLYERLQLDIAEKSTTRDKMDNIFASIASGVIATDQHDQIATINEAAARILGISGADAVGRSLWEILPDLYMGFRELFGDVRDRNREASIEVEPLVVGRGQVSLNLRLSPLKDAQDVSQGVTLVLDDLTESKLQQAQLGAVRRYLPPALVDNIKTIDELELTGVEREISVLFCDVRGFTTFSESLAPEALMEAINRYLSISSEAINLHEGIIDKYMGDAVVGLYNTQLNPQEDHAIRAVRSALAMLHDVADLHETLPASQRLYYGIGVHTGVATLGNVGSPRRKEFTVIGDSLQIAKFVQENASNDVIISGDTYELVKTVFACEAIQARRLKEDGTGKIPLMYLVRGVL